MTRRNSPSPKTADAPTCERTPVGPHPRGPHLAPAHPTRRPGATVAVGKAVDDANFPKDFAPRLFLNGANATKATSYVELFLATQANDGTTGTDHGEFATDGDLAGLYGGAFQALFGAGETRT